MHVAAIRRRAGPPARALEARPHVRRRRRRRRTTTYARSNISSQHRRQPRRRQSRHAAGALRRQRLRRARPVLSRRHPEHDGEARDPERAREMFAYAASYFGDPDAQYQLGAALSRRQRRAARSAPGRALVRARRQQGPVPARRRCSAACCSPASTCRGRRARGLMWLTLASDAPDTAVNDQAWIAELYASAFKQASDDERALALRLSCGSWSERRRCEERPRASSPSGDIQIDIDRHVVGRLVPGAHVRVDAGGRRAGRRPAATAADGRCGCRCSSARRRPGNPRRCRARHRRSTARMRVGQAEIEQRAELLARLRQEQRVVDPGLRAAGRRRRSGMTL